MTSTPNSKYKRRAFILLHGVAGTGKSTLAQSIQGPRLVLDVEGGAQDVDKHILQFTDWMGDPDPERLTPDTSVIVDVVDWESYRSAIDYIIAGKHPFESVVLDSLTAIQKQLRRAIQGKMELGSYEKATYSVWDQLLIFMENDLEELATMRRPSSRRPMSIVVVAASNPEETPQRPILQGGLRRTLPYLFDMEGYLRVEKVTDGKTGEQKRRRVLDIQPSDLSQGETKCRLRLVGEKFGDEIWDPNLSRDILRVINPRPKKEETTTTEKEND